MLDSYGGPLSEVACECHHGKEKEWKMENVHKFL
jgi:hypothetical protein